MKDIRNLKDLTDDHTHLPWQESATRRVDLRHNEDNLGVRNSAGSPIRCEKERGLTKSESPDRTRPIQKQEQEREGCEGLRISFVNGQDFAGFHGQISFITVSNLRVLDFVLSGAEGERRGWRRRASLQRCCPRSVSTCGRVCQLQNRRSTRAKQSQAASAGPRDCSPGLYFNARKGQQGSAVLG